MPSVADPHDLRRVCRIAVIGAGYVGLTTAAGFAHVEADFDVMLRDLAVLAGPLGIDLAGRAPGR